MLATLARKRSNRAWAIARAVEGLEPYARARGATT